MKKTIFFIFLTLLSNVFGGDKQMKISDIHYLSYFEQIPIGLVYRILNHASLIEIHKLKLLNQNMKEIINEYLSYLEENPEILSTKIDKDSVYHLFLNYIKIWQKENGKFNPIDLYTSRIIKADIKFQIFIDEFIKKNNNEDKEGIEILAIKDMVTNIVDGCKKINVISKSHPLYRSLKNFMDLFLLDEYSEDDGDGELEKNIELEDSLKANIYLMLGLHDYFGNHSLFSFSLDEKLKNNIYDSIKKYNFNIIIDFASKDNDHKSIKELYSAKKSPEHSLISKLELYDINVGTICMTDGLLRDVKIDSEQLKSIDLHGNLIENLYINNKGDLVFIDIRNNPLDFFDDDKCEILNLISNYCICFSCNDRNIIFIVEDTRDFSYEYIKNNLKKTLELYKDNRLFQKNGDYKIWFNPASSLVEWAQPDFEPFFLYPYSHKINRLLESRFSLNNCIYVQGF